jgi:hypothetical protein
MWQSLSRVGPRSPSVTSRVLFFVRGAHVGPWAAPGVIEATPGSRWIWVAVSAATGPAGLAAAPAGNGGGTAPLALRLQTMQAIVRDSRGAADVWRAGYGHAGGGSPCSYGSSCLYG